MNGPFTAPVMQNRFGRICGWGALHGLLVLLVLEASARIDDVLTWGAPFFGEYTEETLFVNDSLGYHLRPSGRFQKWRINTHGFRSRETSMAKPAGVTRVITVGASETFGLYESDGAEWPAKLQSLLDSAYPSRYEVLNAAIPGISPGRIGSHFERWLSRFSPDIVIFYPTPSFILPPPSFTASPQQAAAPAPAEESRRGGLSLRIIGRARDFYRQHAPRRVQFAVRQKLIDRAVNRHPPGWVITSVPPERTLLFREQITSLLQVVRSRGADFVLATHAVRVDDTTSATARELLVAQRKQFPNRTAHAIMDAERKANEVVQEVAARHNVPLVDLQGAIPKTSEYFADFAHFTDRGAAVAADAFMKAVLQLSERRLSSAPH